MNMMLILMVNKGFIFLLLKISECLGCVWLDLKRKL